MMDDSFNDDLSAKNGNSISPPEVSWDSMTSALILNDGKDVASNGRNYCTSELSFFQQATSDDQDCCTLELSFFQQATDQTTVSTMTATNPANPYNPNFVYALMTALSNSAKTIALLHNTNNCLENTLLVRTVTQEQEIVVLTASNRFLVNEVFTYVHDAPQQDKEELNKTID